MSVDFSNVLFPLVQILGWTIIQLLAIFIIILSAPIRRKLKEINLSGDGCYQKKVADFYEMHLHVLVIARQILLFFTPTGISFIILGSEITSNFFPSLILLGLTLIVFMSIQLPLLIKAQLLVTFKIDDMNHNSTIAFRAGKETYVESGIHNLGYSTYKNFTVIFYFGEDFKIVPYNDPKYNDLDFKKKFDIQERHGGVVFTPNNFLTIPPQEVFVFPMWTIVPNKEKKGKMNILFHSENTWGMNRIWKTFIVKS